VNNKKVFFIICPLSVWYTICCNFDPQRGQRS